MKNQTENCLTLKAGFNAIRATFTLIDFPYFQLGTVEL
jgi:hypothetical protein